MVKWFLFDRSDYRRGYQPVGERDDLAADVAPDLAFSDLAVGQFTIQGAKPAIYWFHHFPKDNDTCLFNGPFLSFPSILSKADIFRS